MEYYNVVTNADNFATMLKHSNGVRKVPVIVEGEKISIGFEGRS